MRTMAVLLAALLAVSAVSGARVNIMNFNAPAPAPLADKPAADLLFTLSASKAVFTAADRLVLEGPQLTAQAFNTRTRAASTYTLGMFTNATTGAPFAAAWAAAPDAVMYATRDGSVLKALLKLSNPAYGVKAGQLAFAVSVLPADAQRLTLSGGATARAADDVANGLADSLLAEAPVGAELTSIALFIDEESTQVSAAATTKDYWGWYQGQWTYIRTWGNRDQSNSNINNNNVQQNQGGNNQSPPTNINNNNVAGNKDNNGGNTNINNNNVAGNNDNKSNTNINNNNVVNNQNSGNTNINNNNVVNNGNGGNTNINNNNVPNSGNNSSNINNNNVG